MDHPQPASSADVGPNVLAQAYDSAPNGFVLIAAIQYLLDVRGLSHPAMEGLQATPIIAERLIGTLLNVDP